VNLYTVVYKVRYL